MSRPQESFEDFIKRRTIDLANFGQENDQTKSPIFEKDKKLWDSIEEFAHLPYSDKELKRMNLEIESNSLHAIYDTWFSICKDGGSTMGIMEMREAVWMRNCFTKLNVALKEISLKGTEALNVRKEGLEYLQKKLPDFKKIPL